MLSSELKKRCLPDLKSREEMLSVLQNEVYGKIISPPDKISFKKEAEEVIPRFCAGKATLHKIIAECEINGRDFSFPFFAAIPTEKKKHPFFVHINFRSDMPDRFQPTEELIDSGFAVFSVCHNDITTDNDDFSDGLSGVLYPEKSRNSNDAGKIAMWAWAASRVLDYAETLKDVLDMERSVVAGHSRLGKTALFAAATDERFKFCYSNDSGCAGASIARNNKGETVENICESFHYWFCENYKKYINNEFNMMFDQHYLVASIAPRKVLIGSASEDDWADPRSEQLCALASSPAFKNGLKCPERFAEIGEEFLEGDIGYHLRKGTHYFSREDWKRLIRFIELHT
jgi:hypothetical protein